MREVKQAGAQGAATGSLDGAVGLEIRTGSSEEGISPELVPRAPAQNHG